MLLFGWVIYSPVSAWVWSIADRSLDRNYSKSQAKTTSTNISRSSHARLVFCSSLNKWIENNVWKYLLCLPSQKLRTCWAVPVPWLVEVVVSWLWLVWSGRQDTGSEVRRLYSNKAILLRVGLVIMTLGNFHNIQTPTQTQIVTGNINPKLVILNLK